MVKLRIQGGSCTSKKGDLSLLLWPSSALHCPAGSCDRAKTVKLGTAGSKSAGTCFHLFLMETCTVTFVAHCTAVCKPCASFQCW